MFDITNDKRLRAAYILLRTLNSDAPDNPKSSLRVLVSTVKKEIRAYNNRKPPDAYIVKDYGIDGYVELYCFPEWTDHMSKDDAEEWFDCTRRGHYIPSPYDCTGQKFTSWRKLVRRQGHWYAYHSVSIDV